jgi:suppressor for copper-sensitivity B
VLSTSCAAPLLTVAIGFALTGSAYINVLIFNLIALGFSAPYILVLFYPGIIGFIPKSGPWLNTMKKCISILLILTLMWLLFVLYGQIGLRGLCGLVGILILIKLLIESRAQVFYFPWLRPILLAGMCAACFYFPMSAAREDRVHSARSESMWQEFSLQALDQSLQEKKVVFVDVTADWCGTCQYNKITVLDRSWTVEMLR